MASPRHDAELIAAHLLGCSPPELFLRSDAPTPAGFHDAVARRAQREPLQHILGSAPLGPVELAVGPGVFIPRPETELLAHWGVSVLGVDTQPQVVDLCTGSGAIAAYLAHYLPPARITAVELDPDAAAWAEKNLRGSDVELVLGDVTDASILPHLHGRCDLVLSNPPYVPTSTVVSPEVQRDPRHAVFAGADGMSVISPMLTLVAALLKPGGYVGIEHDDATAEAVQNALDAAGVFTGIRSHQDLNQRDRFVTARKL